jgi:hypothetical protein
LSLSLRFSLTAVSFALTAAGGKDNKKHFFRKRLVVFITDSLIRATGPQLYDMCNISCVTFSRESVALSFRAFFDRAPKTFLLYTWLGNVILGVS